MITILFQPGTTVEEALQIPQAARVFLDHKTDCPGCRLARFCTLQEVADIYSIDLQSFLNALQHTAASASQIQRSET